MLGRSAESASKRESRLLKTVKQHRMTSSLIFFEWHVSNTINSGLYFMTTTIIVIIAATKESVDIEDLIDDFITFFFGGQDSTLSMITFALVLTLLHPPVHER